MDIKTRMDKQLAKEIFTKLYQGIDGYKISLDARNKKIFLVMN